jgi:hypothetical protein
LAVWCFALHGFRLRLARFCPSPQRWWMRAAGIQLAREGC